MSRTHTYLAATSLGLLLSATAMAAPDREATTADPEVRAETLVKAMTLEEKLQYVDGIFPPKYTPSAPATVPSDMIPSAGYVLGAPRLGIPTLRESDAGLGVANQVEQRKGDFATALPASLALAASFDLDLAYRSGAMIGGEARAKTFNVLLAGGINLMRDPWGGRAFEYMGEDPLLAGILGGESIRGVQSNHIVSTVKHLALNSQETLRMTVDAQIDEAALRESDLLAFQIAIERGRPGAVMCAYNKVNGDWSCENDFLLNKVLKQDWGFRGWVMSDWGAVHSTVRAVNAGLDQQSGRELDTELFFNKQLAQAVTRGAVSMKRLDEMNRRILWGVASTGLIDHPTPVTAQPIDYAANARVAQEVAEKGIVLLKNEGGVLPLAQTARRIVVVGGHADVGVMSGGGSSQVRSVGGVPIEIALTSTPAKCFVRTTWHASSPLAAIKAMAPDATVTYVDGSDPVAAAAAAKLADLAIVFAWQWRTEAQDVETLSLPERQDGLIDAVAAANKRTVVVLETGGPVLMPWLSRVPAVMEAWYPGQRGGDAIAAVLFGSVNPSGRLPVTFPSSEAQAPRPTIPGLAAAKALEPRRQACGTDDFVDREASVAVRYTEGAAVGYRGYLKDAKTPLFPFGHGLSYTSFRYAGLRLQGGAKPTASFDVTNLGKRAGADTPQIYVTAGRRDEATTRLAGFERVELAAGETRRVTIAIDPRIIADYDVAQPGWHVAAGNYSLAIGHFAGDEALKGTLTLDDIKLKP